MVNSAAATIAWPRPGRIPRATTYTRAAEAAKRSTFNAAAARQRRAERGHRRRQRQHVARHVHVAVRDSPGGAGCRSGRSSCRGCRARRRCARRPGRWPRRARPPPAARDRRTARSDGDGEEGGTQHRQRRRAWRRVRSDPPSPDYGTRRGRARPPGGPSDASRSRVDPVALRRGGLRHRGPRRAAADRAAAPAAPARAGPHPPGVAEGAPRARAAGADAAARRGDVDRGLPRVQRGPGVLLARRRRR